MNKTLSPSIVPFLSYSDLHPGTVSKEEDLRARLKDLDLKTFIISLAKINLIISDISQPISLKPQEMLKEKIFDDYTKQLIEGRKKDASCFFHRAQLLYLMKQGFLFAKEKHIDLDKTTSMGQLKKLFSLVFLIANDLLRFFDTKTIEEAEGEQSKMVIWKETLPLWEMNNPPEIKPALARARKMFGAIAEDGSNNQDYLDLFSKEKKITLNEYMYFVFSLVAFYHNCRNSILINPDSFFIRKQEFLNNIKNTTLKQSFGHFINNISIPFDKITEVIKKSPDCSLLYGFLPFRKCPIVMIDDNDLICLDIYFLLDKLGSGLFWEINGLLGRNEQEEYHSLWGSLFETYVSFLLMDSKYGSKSSIFIKPCYDNSGDEIADVLILHEENLIVMEVKFGLITQESKYGKDVSTLIDEIREKYEKNKKGEWKGYGQLANNINKLFSKHGSYNFDRINKNKIKNVIPILVTYENSFSAPFTNYFFNSYFQPLLKKEELTGNIVIWPLTLITIEELERAIYMEDNLDQIIMSRLKNDMGIYFSLNDYLNNNYSHSLPYMSWINKEWEKFGKETKKYFFD